MQSAWAAGLIQQPCLRAAAWHHCQHSQRRLCRRCIQASVSQHADQASQQKQVEAAPSMLMQDLRVVLVAPKGRMNVGAVARACANFEVPDLWVVSPRCDVRDEEVYQVACGETVVDGITIANSLEQALADTTSSIGFTRRAGCTRLVHGSIKTMLEAYPEVISNMRPHAANSRWQAPAAPAPGGVTALVFGREENGLSEDELRRCSHACALPTGRLQPSMNLSHAVAVALATCWELRLAALGLEDEQLGIERLPGAYSAGSPQQQGLQSVTASELEALLAKVSRIAAAVGISDEECNGGGSHGRRRLPLGHIRAVLSRARTNTWEVRSMHGLASAVMRALGIEGSSGTLGAPEQLGTKQHRSEELD